MIITIVGMIVIPLTNMAIANEEYVKNLIILFLFEVLIDLSVISLSISKFSHNELIFSS